MAYRMGPIALALLASGVQIARCPCVEERSMKDRDDLLSNHRVGPFTGTYLAAHVLMDGVVWLAMVRPEQQEFVDANHRSYSLRHIVCMHYCVYIHPVCQSRQPSRRKQRRFNLCESPCQI